VTSQRILGATVLAASITVMVALGVCGVGHGGETHLDTPILYAAGEYWQAGGSAYTRNVVPHVSGAIGDTLDRYTFAYPPQSAPLFLLLAIGSAETANTIMTIFNLVSLAALAYLTVRLAEPDDSEMQHWIIPALVIGNLSTVFVVWMGQTTLIMTAALAGAWYYARRGEPIVAGIFLAVATMKPPLSLFVVAWFVLEREWKVLGTMTVAILVMASIPMYQSGPIQVYLDWLGSLGNYGVHASNALGSRMLFNLQSLLFAVGITTPSLIVFGLIGTLALWYWRHVFVENDLLGVVLGITLLFGYGHSYDIAALVLLIPAFWRRVHDSAAASAVALTMLFAISFPNSVLEPYGSLLLLHARVAVLCVALVWLLWLSADAAPERGGYSGVQGLSSTASL